MLHAADNHTEDISIMLQFISHYNSRYGYLDSIGLALKGGCRWIQLRVKDMDDTQAKDIALRAMSMCREYGATFIIDDRVELVREIGADGVHLGLNDMPVDEARKILGDKFIIGGTANTFEHVQMHYSRGADYLGIGPYRFTSTKKNLSAILGLEGYRNITGRMKEAGIDIPTVAIGGITYDDIVPVMQTGVTGIAVSGTILNADDPEEECRRILALMEGNHA